MQFNDTTNEQGIIQSISWHTGADLVAYTLNSRTRAANKYLRKAIQFIQEADGKWQWDDKNATTLPIATTDLVAGQRDYTLNDDVREIERVEVLIENGTTKKQLRPLDIDTVHGSIDEVFEQDAQPTYYRLLGESMMLYPSPDYNATDGLIIWEKRAAGEFLPSDTTKEPPFDSQYHDYIALGASYDYLVSLKDDFAQADRIKRDLDAMEADMKKYYSRRGGKARVVARRNPKL